MHCLIWQVKLRSTLAHHTRQVGVGPVENRCLIWLAGKLRSHIRQVGLMIVASFGRWTCLSWPTGCLIWQVGKLRSQLKSLREMVRESHKVLKHLMRRARSDTRT